MLSPTSVVTFDLREFGVAEMLRCGRAVKDATAPHAFMEDAARGIARYFYDTLRDADSGERQCVLVRMYKTHPYGKLAPPQQEFARALLGPRPATGDITCLTLLGTAGDEESWCDRRRSRGHQAIPLASVEMIEQAPMIAALIRQLGLDAEQLLQPGTPILQSHRGKSFDVFHVADAAGSPFIPAQQEFVASYGVRSVVGFGGLLRSGSLFSVILFSRVPIDVGTAERFRYIALDVKYALFAMDDDHVFADRAESQRGGPTAMRGELEVAHPPSDR